MVRNLQNGQLRSSNQINLSKTYLTRRPAYVRTPKWRMFTFTVQSFADRRDDGVAHMAVLPPPPLRQRPFVLHLTKKNDYERQAAGQPDVVILRIVT